VIMNRYQRPIVGFAYRMVHDRETALDLSQEIFVKAYNSLGTYDDRYKFSTWLYKIASNHVIDHLRRKEPRWVSIDTRYDDDDRPFEIADTRPNQASTLAFTQISNRIDAAIKQLPTSYRRLITLRHVNDCSYEEIAKICDIPLGTVKNRIFRAREILRRALEGVL